MHSMPTRLLLLTLLFIAGQSKATPLQDSDIRPQVASLISSPGRCVLRSGQHLCQMKLNLIWEAPQQAHYCIMRKDVALPLKCWQGAWRGSVEIDFLSANKTYYWLKQSAIDKVLVETSIAVTASYKQRKRAQRRKRGFWRMF